MRTTLISMEEYLDTAYSPDREFIDGEVVERHVGERPHSRVQRNTIAYFAIHYPDLPVWPEQRVRTVRNRSRVPDICITLEDPEVDVFEMPPFICIEILSRRDEMTDVMEKLEEYLTIGVPHIWLIDPRRKKAFTYDGNLNEVTGSGLLAEGPGLLRIELPFAELFRGL